ncbi:MAG: hypothetical protein IJC43_01830, partial [Clostridia bacterium]|nr:hypothetical protein [Clostridia bacterium]
TAQPAARLAPPLSVTAPASPPPAVPAPVQGRAGEPALSRQPAVSPEVAALRTAPEPAEDRLKIPSDPVPFGPVVRDLKHSGSRPITSLTAPPPITAGTPADLPLLRPEQLAHPEALAAYGYRPMTLEHGESASTAPSAPGQSPFGHPIPEGDSARRLAQALESAAHRAERSLMQRKGATSGSRAASRPAEQSAPAAPSAPPSALADTGPQSRETPGQERTQPASLPARPQPSADTLQTAPPLGEPTGPSRTTPPALPPSADRPAAQSPRPGLLRDLERIAVHTYAAEPAVAEIQTALTPPTEAGPFADLSARPPLSLEYLQDTAAGEASLPAASAALSPQVLQKWMDTPGLRLLGKNIAVLAAQSLRPGPAPQRSSRPTPTAPVRAPQRATTAPGEAGSTALRSAATHPAVRGSTPSVPSPASHTGRAAAQTGRAAPILPPMTASLAAPRTGGHRPGAISPGAPAPILPGLPGSTIPLFEAEAWANADRLPLELTHMSPSLQQNAAVPLPGQPPRQNPAALQETLIRQVERSLSTASPAVQTSLREWMASEPLTYRQSQSAAPSPAAAPQPGRRGQFLRSILSRPIPTALRRMGTVPRGRHAAAPGTAPQSSAAQEALGAYSALSMEYGGPLAAMARELWQTAQRGPAPAAPMGLQTAAARAIEEKGAPEPMQTLDLMTGPQIEQQQIVWQNPYLRSAPTEMSYHRKNDPQKPQPAQPTQPQLRMSDAELRRAADKVFKLVQEKIIAERRRIGRF